MEKEEIEFAVNWIVADYIPFYYDNQLYSIRSPSREAKVIGDEIFLEYYYKSIEEGVLDSDGVYKLLKAYRIWNEEKESLLNKLNEEIETMKVEVYNNYLNLGTRAKIKIAIRDTKLYIEKLLGEKQTFDYLGADFIANYARHQLLLGYSIYKGKRPLWRSTKRWDLPDQMSKEINTKLNKYRLTSDNYREIATSDYWRSIYNIKRGNLFGKPIVDYSDHQRYLIGWSQSYENIYKSADCPPDEVVNDFDAIDGWFIVQKRKRDAELNKQTIESGLSDKIRNSQHIFIVRDPQNEEAADFTKKIYGLNDAGGKIALHKRLKQINQQGSVTEANMLDTRLILQEKAFELNKRQ